MSRRITVLVSFAVALAGCEKLSALLPQSPKVLKSADGALQLTVPGAWTDDSGPDRQMNDRAAIQASRRADELYVLVLSQPKEGNMDLARFSELTRGSQLRAMKNATEEGPKQRTVSGMPATEYLLKGTSDESEIVLKHVAIDGTKAHHQIVVWTLKSSWEKEKGGLDKVIDSFKEVAATK